MRVFVLLFNARTENEGIHTIREGDRNKILMFESQDDAERFAMLLEAQDFPTATPEAMDADEVKEFCDSAGYAWEIVAADGSLVIPPEVNVENTDWNPENDTDASKNPIATQYPQTEPEIPDTELDSIRRKLEGLL
jgi:Protein of unknown function (DUF3110)